MDKGQGGFFVFSLIGLIGLIGGGIPKKCFSSSPVAKLISWGKGVWGGQDKVGGQLLSFAIPSPDSPFLFYKKVKGVAGGRWKVAGSPIDE